MELDFEHLAVGRQVSVRCCPLLHLLCCLVNKPGFVLTVKLLEIRQLNTLLLFPGPLVESLQTNLKDNQSPGHAELMCYPGCDGAVVRGSWTHS